LKALAIFAPTDHRGCGMDYNYVMSHYKLLSDEQLVEQIRSKDRELYSHLVDRYQTKLMRYAKYLIDDDHKAADVVQEAFIKAYINLNGFDTRKKFSSWLYRIAHNQAMNSVKKYHRESPLNPDFDLPSSEDIEEDFTKNEIIAKTHDCLSHMPVMYSEPLVLYYLEAKSYDEISDILRLPVGTVGTRINRAKSLMKILCQKLT
jgi:RNA polymerase sigma-70 factor, ECF subfamily